MVDIFELPDTVARGFRLVAFGLVLRPSAVKLFVQQTRSKGCNYLHLQLVASIIFGISFKKSFKLQGTMHGVLIRKILYILIHI